MKKIICLCFFTILISQGFAQQVHPDSTLTNFFRREKGMIAADGGYTIPLSDGRVLWLFGDSYVDDLDPQTGTTPCLFGANNSLLVQPKGDWDWRHTITQPGSNGTQSFFKAQPDNFIWPLDGFQHGDTVYVYCLNQHRTGSGQYDMKDAGDTWAKIYIPTMRVVNYSPLQDFTGITFGEGFIKDAGFVYTYGLAKNKIYAARFPENNPNARWLFWDGSNWQPDVKKCAAIADIPGFSMYMCKVKDRYVLFSAEFSLACDGGKAIYATSSTSPTGPFPPRKTIYTIPDKKQGHSPFFYGPLAHVEYINDKDELLMDYSINGYEPCVPSCVNGKFDPDNYRARAIWIPLKVIDPAL
jgi:hypothetical protein